MNSSKANGMTGCRLPNIKLRKFYDFIHKHTILLIIHRIHRLYLPHLHAHNHTFIGCLMSANNVIALICILYICRVAIQLPNKGKPLFGCSVSFCSSMHCYCYCPLLQLIWRQTRNDEVIEHTHLLIHPPTEKKIHTHTHSDSTAY